MSAEAIGPGAILHWEQFKFPNGTEADKFFVVVGAQPGRNFLAIIATSKQGPRNADPGGNPKGGYYALRGEGKDWFPKPTWLLFEEPQELSAAELVRAVEEGTISVVGQLHGDRTNHICNCMRHCNDVSPYHVTLLGPAIQSTKKV